MTPDPICDLSDLPASQCGMPCHRGGTVSGLGSDDVDRVGPVIEARYFGTCVACEHVIIPGRDSIQALRGQDGYAHAPRCT